MTDRSGSSSGEGPLPEKCRDTAVFTREEVAAWKTHRERAGKLVR